MKPIVFHVEAGGEFQPVNLSFARESDVKRVRTWRKNSPPTDAGEFAALAAKRWFYYAREHATVETVEELRAGIKRNHRAEIAFLLVASATWTRRGNFLALAYCRRTWCHHLALDFLAVRPTMGTSKERISGLGTGMLFSVAKLASALRMKIIWGEATATSAPFYERVLQSGPVEDLFVIKRDAIEPAMRRYFTNQKPRLAKTLKQR